MKRQRRRRGPPTELFELEPGDIVRTRAGYLQLSWFSNGGATVRLVDPETLRDISYPFAVTLNLPVLEVLRDQSRYRPGGKEFDPVKDRRNDDGQKQTK